MVTEYGMSERLGLVTYERERRPMFLPESFGPGKIYSEEKAAEIDAEISKVVEDCHQRVRRVLGEKREMLNTLARLLLEKEVVQGDEMRALMGKPGPALPGDEKKGLPPQQPAA
jgi:cell division protease FtsH